MVKIRCSYSKEYYTCKGVDELKPCPFCGGLESLSITDRDNFSACFKAHGDATIGIHCGECGLDLYEHNYHGNRYATKAKILIKKWNARGGDTDEE